MVLPALVGSPAGRVLPPAPFPHTHQASLEELYERFVEQAPFRESRERLFQALRLYLDDVLSFAPVHSAWINGGFITLKEWGPPQDIDLVLKVSATEMNMLSAELRKRFRRAMTLPSGIDQSGKDLGKTAPMNGMIDAYYLLDNQMEDARRWHAQWSSLRGPEGHTLDDTHKGFVEVMFR